MFDPNHRHLEERIKKMEEAVVRIENTIVFLSKVKCNARPFQWLNHRVGQVERRLDRVLDDGWEGDLENTTWGLVDRESETK